MKNNQLYNSQLGAGLGLIEETQTLLTIWQPGMTSQELYQTSLAQGSFPNISARRLRNLVIECFKPRYLVEDDYPAEMLKEVKDLLPTSVFAQLLLLFTARANPILNDFIKNVYWAKYAGGYEAISNEDAREFVLTAIREGKTISAWSDSMVKNVASYLTGACADFGLLERGRKSVRRIIPFRVEPRTVAMVAYDLHFSGLGDNAVVTHSDWELFGLEKEEVLEEIKRLSLKGFFIVQTAAEVVRISWNYKTWENLTDVIAQS